jgi:hypothetical protein
MWITFESLMPLFLCLWFESTIFAASRRIFFGSHPRKAHVPPNGSESIIATHAILWSGILLPPLSQQFLSLLQSNQMLFCYSIITYSQLQLKGFL